MMRDFPCMGQSLKALLQATVHWFFSRGGVGIKFALAIILCAGLGVVDNTCRHMAWRICLVGKG